MTRETQLKLSAVTRGFLTDHEHQWFLGCLDTLVTPQTPHVERRKNFRMASRSTWEDTQQRSKRR